MTLRVLLIAYTLGGLTFLPLLALSVLAALWYTLPKVDERSRDGTISYHGVDKKDAATITAQTSKSTIDGAASATFAVLRHYNFQGATAAFKEASNAAIQVEASADGKGGGESISVYQSMYRSVFDRNKNVANPMQEGEQVQQYENTKARARGKVFFIVLRHGHLMLYDTQVQLEVRHVISLAHYNISLQDEISTSSVDILDADLFTKRTAIVLTARPDKQVDGIAPLASSNRKPFYLFCDVNIEKEDFYHALLTSLADPPIPKSIDPEHAIKLQSALHSNSLSLETRALNALLGRIFLGTHRTPFMETFIRNKIEKKMARIQKPSFIASIACHSLSLGDAAPIISNVRLKDLNIQGETTIAFDFKYNGGLNLTIAAAAKLDLGQRFKTRIVSLLLAVVLQRIQGKMLVKIKPPPSNRVWFCFETMPDMELKIEPVVSSRQITYAFVLRAIEARVREAFAEGLVKPNWDDVPFFATTAQKWRGGIWESEGQQEVEVEEILGSLAADSNPLSARDGKAPSSPALTPSADSNVNQASSTGAQTPEAAFDNLKHRAAAGLAALTSKATPDLANAQSAADKAWVQTSPTARAPRFVRAPSYASPKALVAVDDLSADAVRSNDLPAAPARRRWMSRGGQVQAMKRDAAEVVRQVRDRDTLGRKDEAHLQVPEGDDTERASLHTHSDDANDFDSTRRSSEPGTTGNGSEGKRTMTGFGSMTAGSSPRLSGTREQSFDSEHSRNGSQDSGSFQQRKTILASTAAATNAARQWTWNAVANRANRQQMNRNLQRQGSRAPSESELVDPSKPQLKDAEPIGRGQPLPPPGVPLPGPSAKGLWSAAAAGLGGMRKKTAPRLPARRLQTDSIAATPDRSQEDLNSQSTSDQNAMSSSDALDAGHEVEEGEYGPWMANDDESTRVHDQEAVNYEARQAHTTAERQEDEVQELATPVVARPHKKAPPPLPPRRRAGLEDSSEKSKQHRTADEVNEAGVADDAQHLSASHHHDDIVTSDTGHSEDDNSAQNPTPPDLIDLSDETETDEENHNDTVHESIDTIPDDDELELEDDIEAIPAPVDAEAEETGVLDMAEHAELPTHVEDERGDLQDDAAFKHEQDLHAEMS